MKCVSPLLVILKAQGNQKTEALQTYGEHHVVLSVTLAYA